MRLSHLALVNWHLFDREDVELKGHVGLLGGNRSGKSTILDMIQVVMAGAHARFYKLNAVANDTRRSATKRTVAGYCLGVTSEDRLRRPDSRTYVVLGFENDDGSSEPVSIGLALEAKASERSETILGRFIVRGRIVRTEELVRTEGGQTFPMDWSELRHRWEQDATIDLKSFSHSDRAVDFIREYMRVLVPSRSPDARSAESMLKALVNAISLKEDLTAEQFMRQFILEESPMNIAQLRASIDTYRSVAETIVKLREKLGLLHRIAASVEVYERARDRSRIEDWAARRARFLAAKAGRRQFVLQRDQAAARIAARQAEIDELAEHVRETKECIDSTNERIREHASSSGRAMFQSQREGAELRMENARRDFDRYRTAILDLCTAISASEADVGEWRMVSADAARLLQTATVTGEIDEASAVSRRLLDGSHAFEEAADKAIDRLRREGAGERRVLEELGSVREGTARRPDTHLSDDTLVLMRLLRGEGMDPRPLCDLLRIREDHREWTIAAEGLLGRDREAIFVSRHHVERATRIARGSKAQCRSASLVSLNKLRRVGIRPVPGTFPAIFESDDEDAIAFVVQRHESVTLASTVEEFERPGRTIMQDGYYDDGLVRRHRGAREGDFKIGAEAQATLVASRVRRFEEAVAAMSVLSERERPLRAMVKALGSVRGLADENLVEIASRYVSAASARGKAEDAIVAIDASGDGGLRRDLHLFGERLRRDAEALAAVEKVVSADRDVVRFAEYTLRSPANTPGSLGDLNVNRRMYAAIRQTVRPFAEGRPAYRSRWDRQLAGRPALDTSRPEGMAEVARIHQRIAERAEADRTAAARSVTDRERILVGEIEDYLKVAGPSGQIGRDSDILTAVKPFVEASISEIEGNALRHHEEKAKEATKTATHLFRTQFVLDLTNRLETLKRERLRLNRTLEAFPFHHETYSFRMTKVPKYAPVIQMAEIVNTAFGSFESDPLELLFDDEMSKEHEHYETVHAVRSLLEDPNIDVAEFEDYRNFYTFDIVMTDGNGRSVEWEKRRGTGSGAEQQVPIYVAVGASLAAVYGASRADRPGEARGIAPALFDEAFSRMDGNNQRQMMSFYESLGLQVIIAAPMEKRIALAAYMETIVEVDRDGDHSYTETTFLKQRARDELLAIDPDNRTETELRAMLEAAE